MKNPSCWHFVSNLDLCLQLPCRTARGAGRLHLKTLCLQNCCRPADRTKANAILAQPHDNKSGIQKRDKDRESIICCSGEGDKTNLSSNQQRVRQIQDRFPEFTMAQDFLPRLRSPWRAQRAPSGTNVIDAVPRQASEASDPVLEKAKVTVASKMEDQVVAGIPLRELDTTFHVKFKRSAVWLKSRT